MQCKEYRLLYPLLRQYFPILAQGGGGSCAAINDKGKTDLTENSGRKHITICKDSVIEQVWCHGL